MTVSAPAAWFVIALVVALAWATRPTRRRGDRKQEAVRQVNEYYNSLTEER